MKNLFAALMLIVCLTAAGFATDPVFAAEQVVAASVNLNQASAAELQVLPGVGPALADRIVDYCEVRGPFETVNPLAGVKGIGDRKLEKIRPSVTLN